VILGITSFVIGSAFLKFGIGTDLSDYRDAVQEMEIEAQQKDALLDDFERLRLSVAQRNQIGFFEWVEIDDSIRGMLADGMLDGRESESLRADIDRMHKIQGLSPARESE